MFQYSHPAGTVCKMIISSETTTHAAVDNFMQHRTTLMRIIVHTESIEISNMEREICYN